MATVREKRKAFREMLRGTGCQVAPSAYDALGAKLVERAGFRVVHMTGSGIHKSFGFTDAGLLTLTEQTARATMLADAVNVPVVGDCETGFGNVVNLVRAVRELERSGVAAIHIEDQVTPKRPMQEGAAAEFVSKAEYVGKIKAAVDTRADPLFSIIARIDSRASDSYESVVERGLAACEAGADAIWIGLSDEDEMRRVTKAIPRPMMGVPRRPKITPQIYEEMGYKVAIIPGMLAQAASWGMSAVLKALMEKGSEAELVASLDGYDDIRRWFNSVGASEVQEIESRYMKA
jgi:2-methylisocitrate lyase-like PEP mutase family enzyme